MSCKNAIAVFIGPIVFGTVKFHQCQRRSPTVISFDLKGFKPNKTHAIHIHEYGDMSDGCKSLGSHWNPKNNTHGSIFVEGMPRHSGDLINNLKSNRNGKFELEYSDPLVNVEEIYGRSVVIHEGIDDLGLGDNKESLITGNAGGRMACAIIGRTK